MTAPLPIFDGHNDTLLRLWRSELPTSAFFERGDGGPSRPAAGAGRRLRRRAVRLLRAVRDPRRGPAGAGARRVRAAVPGHAQPRSGALGRGGAGGTAGAGGARVGRVPSPCAAPAPSCAPRSRPAIWRPSCTSRGPRRSTPSSRRWTCCYAAGLRSLGPVWSRPNVFGHGVPFRFPSPPDTGPGLTDAGKALVKGLQRAADHARPQPPQRGGVLGRGGAQRRTAGRDPLQRARALPVLAQPDRQAARRDPRDRRRGGAEPRRQLPARRRPQRRRHAGRDAGAPMSTIWSSGWASTAWRWAPTSTAAPCRPASRMPPGCRC